MSGISEKLTLLECKINNIQTSLSVLKNNRERQKKDILQLTEEVEISKSKLPTELIHEVQLRLRKSKSVIISDIDEATSGTADERSGNDAAEVKKLFHQMGVKPNTHVSDTSRIGRNSKLGKRLIRVTFADENTRNEVLRNAKKLSSCAELRHVYIHPDRTPTEQRQFSILRQELKDRRDAGEDVVIFNNKVLDRKEVNSSKNFQ